jgi:hypothetical protein
MSGLEEQGPTPEEEAAELARLDAELNQYYAQFDQSDLSLQEKFDLDFKNASGKRHAQYAALMNSKSPPPPPPQGSPPVAYKIQAYLAGEWNRTNGLSTSKRDHDTKRVSDTGQLGLAFTASGTGSAGLLRGRRSSVLPGARPGAGGRRTKRSNRKNKRSASKRKRSNRRRSSRK